MVGVRSLGDVLFRKDRVIEVLQIPDQRSGALHRPASLVAFVVHVEEAMVLGQPALVRVGDVGVCRHRDRDRVVLVRHVGDAQRVLVGAEADLPAEVVLVRTVVGHALTIVRVPGSTPAGAGVEEAPGETGPGGLAEIEHVKSAAAGLSAAAGSHHVRESLVFVDDDVVRACDALIEEVGLEGDGLGARFPEPPEVEHLDPVLLGPVGHDVDVVAVDLHVPPDAAPRAGGLGQVAQHHRVVRVGEVHKGGAVAAPHDGDLVPGLGVRPAPDIVHHRAPSSGQLNDRQEGDDVHVVALESGSQVLGARNFFVEADDCRQPAVVPDHEVAAGPCPVRTSSPEDRAPRPAVDAAGPHYGDVPGERQRTAEGGAVAEAVRPGFDHPRPAPFPAVREVIEAPRPLVGVGCSDPHAVAVEGNRGTEPGGVPPSVECRERARLGPGPRAIVALEDDHLADVVRPGRPDQRERSFHRERRSKHVPLAQVLLRLQPGHGFQAAGCPVQPEGVDFGHEHFA